MNRTSRRLALATIVVICIGIAGMAAIFVAIPWLARVLRFVFPQYVPTLIFMYIGALLALWLLAEFLLIMRTVQRGQPFVLRNVRSLLHIAICCGICAADMLFMVFVTPSVTLGICAGILAFGMLCAIVLAHVFRQAVLFKEENDLTI